MEKERQIIENQVALFNLLGALYYEMTGRKPKVEVITLSGVLSIHPDWDAVKSQGEVSQTGVESQRATRKGAASLLVC